MYGNYLQDISWFWYADPYCKDLVFPRVASYLLGSFFARPRSAIGRASDLKARDIGFDTDMVTFLLPLIQEGELLVTDAVMGAK